MTRQDATDLATLIVQTWRGGPQATVWEDELGNLHTNQARTTYEKLRRTLEHAPSIARFLAEYRALTQTPDERPGCGHCNHSGWIEIVDHRRHGPGCRIGNPDFPGTVDSYGDPGDCHCTATTPCDCQLGRTMGNPRTNGAAA